MNELHVAVSGLAGAGKSSLAVFISDYLEQEGFTVELNLADVDESTLRRSVYPAINHISKVTKVLIKEEQLRRNTAILEPFDISFSEDNKKILIRRSDVTIKVKHKHLDLFLSMLKLHINEVLLPSDETYSGKFSVMKRDESLDTVVCKHGMPWTSKYAIVQTYKETNYWKLYGLEDGIYIATDTVNDISHLIGLLEQIKEDLR